MAARITKRGLFGETPRMIEFAPSKAAAVGAAAVGAPALLGEVARHLEESGGWPVAITWSFTESGESMTLTESDWVD